MDQYGETIYGTRGGDVAPHPWGVSTRKGDRLFIHVLDLKDNTLYIPLKAKVKKQCNSPIRLLFPSNRTKTVYC